MEVGRMGPSAVSSGHLWEYQEVREEEARMVFRLVKWELLSSSNGHGSSDMMWWARSLEPEGISTWEAGEPKTNWR